MKEGWKYEQMGNVCTFISGYTPAKELLSKSGSIPYYKVSDMNTEGNEVLLNKTSLYLSNAKKIIPQGSVVFPKNGGAIFTNKKRMLVCDSVVDLNTEAIFPNKNIVTTNFLYKLLLSIDLGQFDNGGGLPSINIKKMQSFTIPIPPLPEQERIVSLLDAEFAKIDAIKANAEKQLKEAKALFQSSLKDYLTPKEGWSDGILGNIAYIVHGKNQKDVVDSLGKYPIYGSGGNVMGYANDYLCDEGTTILGRKGTINNPVYVNSKFWNVDTAFGICAKENVDKRFLFYIIKSEDWQARNTGTTLPSLTQTVVLSVPIFYPSLSEQQQIAEQLDKLSAKIKSLQSNFDTTVTLCNDLKQSILKDIFG